jgi:O-antigen/teichoic acid export membrane protein
MPMSLIGSSVVEVFRQRAIADYHARGECRAAFAETFRLLGILGLPPMLALAAFGPSLFGFVFGRQWVAAGEFARVLAPMMLLRFVVSPLTYVYYIAGRQKEDFLLHLAMVITTAAAMWSGYVLFHTAFGMIGMFSANYCLIYLVYLARSYRMSLGNGENAVHRVELSAASGR